MPLNAKFINDEDVYLSNQLNIESKVEFVCSFYS